MVFVVGGYYSCIDEDKIYFPPTILWLIAKIKMLCFIDRFMQPPGKKKATFFFRAGAEMQMASSQNIVAL